METGREFLGSCSLALVCCGRMKGEQSGGAVPRRWRQQEAKAGESDKAVLLHLSAVLPASWF